MRLPAVSGAADATICCAGHAYEHLGQSRCDLDWRSKGAEIPPAKEGA